MRPTVTSERVNMFHADESISTSGVDFLISASSKNCQVLVNADPVHLKSIVELAQPHGRFPDQELRGIQDSNQASVAARERGRGQGFDAVLVDRCLVYGKNDPFRSWPISANELEEVTIGSETNV